MAKLEGIICKAFGNYVVLRGYAPIKDIAAISHKPEAYQRDANPEHKADIIRFLSDNRYTYKYFPEVTLACRVENYTALLNNLENEDRDITAVDVEDVAGLHVLSERIPYYSFRARHANLTKYDAEDLVRVDGNHRLEPFDDPNDAVWADTGADYDELGNTVIPFSVIFSNAEEADNFEAGIFHNINFKQKPLRYESSLKILKDLTMPDSSILEMEYPLTLELIEKVEKGQYGEIPWLRQEGNVEKEYYRTACLRIAQLLYTRKEVIKKELEEEIERSERIKDAVAKSVSEMSDLISRISQVKESLKKDEREIVDYEKSYSYRENRQLLDSLESSLHIAINKKDTAEYRKKRHDDFIKEYQGYLQSIDDSEVIAKKIASLNTIYAGFGENTGNIAMLCVMVYYALLNKHQLEAFVSWAKKNGINKLKESGEFNKDAANDLVEMYEQIYQTKKNNIFISMQFNDDQSELIYVKIEEAIAKFNRIHGDMLLNPHPIRIDRNVEKSAFSIPDRILEAITSSGLLIADLSSANINVYHEVGFAMGLAKTRDLLPNIILLYKEDTRFNTENRDVDKFIGFNLRNLSQLRFRNYDQIVDELVKRIEAHYGV